jgi:hypothetical protein
MYDNNTVVSYTAAAAVLRLSALRERATVEKHEENEKKATQ